MLIENDKCKEMQIDARHSVVQLPPSPPYNPPLPYTFLTRALNERIWRKFFFLIILKKNSPARRSTHSGHLLLRSQNRPTTGSMRVDDYSNLNNLMSDSRLSRASNSFRHAVGKPIQGTNTCCMPASNKPERPG